MATEEVTRFAAEVQARAKGISDDRARVLRKFLAVGRQDLDGYRLALAASELPDLVEAAVRDPYINVMLP